MKKANKVVASQEPEAQLFVNAVLIKLISLIIRDIEKNKMPKKSAIKVFLSL